MKERRRKMNAAKIRKTRKQENAALFLLYAMYFFSFYPHFFHSFFLQFRQKAVKIIEDLPENISHQKYRHNHSDNTAYTDCKSAHRAFHFPDLNRFRCSYRMAGCPYGKSCRNRIRYLK